MAKRGLQSIVVLGTGYVGLPLAIMLARGGFKVVGVDIKKEVVKALNEGVLHVHEKDIEKIFDEESVRRNLKAMERPCEADAFIIAVPTPLDKKRKICDISQVLSSVESITEYLRKGNLIIVESTVPPLTCRNTIKPIIEKRTGLRIGKDVFLAHCPERILPGDVFQEIINNDRVIGGVTERSAILARDIYRTFVRGQIHLTDDVTAELCKLAENTYRDINIAYANELSLVAESLGTDFREVIDLANKHPRVKILNPGIGVGGHCIAIDPWFIKEVDPEHSQLIQAARNVNDAMPGLIAAKIRRLVGNVREPRIIVLGMTYKPNTYDTRESPAMAILEELKSEGYDIKAYDPFVEGHKYRYGTIGRLVRGADCLALLVPHDIILKELREKESEIKRAMRNPLWISPATGL